MGYLLPDTLIMLRVKELATAEMLTDQLPKVEVFTLMSVSGVDDSSDPTSGIDFKSRNEGEPEPFVQWTKEVRRTPGQDVRAGA